MCILCFQFSGLIEKKTLFNTVPIAKFSTICDDLKSTFLCCNTCHFVEKVIKRFINEKEA